MHSAVQLKCHAIQFAVVLSIVAFAEFAASADEGVTMAVDTQKTHKGIAVVQVESAIYLTIRNDTDAPIEFARPDSLTGFQNLSIEFKDTNTGKILRAHRRPLKEQYLTELLTQAKEAGFDIRNVAPGKAMPAVAQIGFRTDSNTLYYGGPEPNDMHVYSMTVHYDFKHTATGTDKPTRISSKPVDVYVTSTRYNTPYDYFSNGNPERAMELIKFDPAWVNWRAKLQAPMLILAAQQNQLEVVRLLLDLGADIDTPYREGIRALHSTSDIEIVKLLIDRGADLDSGLSKRTRSALQRAIARGINAKDEKDRQRWNAIADLLIEKGAYYDLRSAILRDDRKRIVEIESEPDRIFDTSFDSALRVAAALNKYEMCKFLIEEKNADVNSMKPSNMDTPYPAIIDALKHQDIVQLFIEHGADVSDAYQLPWGRRKTVLHDAARFANAETIKLLLDAGADPVAKEYIGDAESSESTPLEKACSENNMACVRTILTHPSFTDINQKSKQQALDRAFLTCARPNTFPGTEIRLSIVELVLEAGANPNATDDKGRSAIDYLAGNFWPAGSEVSRNIQTTINLIRQHGGEIDIFAAAAVGDHQTLKKLLLATPKPHKASSYKGEPALFVAARLNRKSAVKALVEADFEIDQPYVPKSSPATGDTALHEAASCEHVEIVKILLEAGANPNARNEELNTPLHNAAFNNNFEIVELLLKHGASPTSSNIRGKTPLDNVAKSDEPNAEKIQKLMFEYNKK